MRFRKIFWLALLLILFSGLALFYFKVYNKRVNNAPVVGNTQTSAGANTTVKENEIPRKEVEVFVKFPEIKDDADYDGVSDEVEKKFGTSSGDVDTDNDGLTDKIEIEKLGTDPTKHDTDGDGYADGVELSGGYNPLGPGKLAQ